MKRLLLVLLLLLAPAGVSLASPLPSAQTIISNLDKTFSKIEDYTCTADAHYRKGNEREDKVYKIYFKKPSLVRIEVLEGDGGSVAVLTKDGKVKAHRGGFFSWIVLHLDLDNPLVKTIRGHRMDQSHFGYMIDNMKAGLAKEEIVVRREQVVDGIKTYVLETKYKVPFEGVTRGMAFIDSDRWLIKKLLAWEGSREVINVTYYDVAVNKGLDDGLFDM